MLIALTGATGFVGRHIADTLIRRDHRVRALVRNPARLPAGHALELVRGDLADREALRSLVAGVDAVIHLVGIIVERGPGASFEAVHVEGTRRLLDAALAAGCRRWVHMSAVGARDQPGATAYHRTKWRAEELVRASGMSPAVFRPSIINGPENAPIRTLARLHRWAPVIPVFGDGRFPVQPIWVDDVARAFALAAEDFRYEGGFELGGPRALTYADFVRAIGRACGHPRPTLHVPLPLVRAAARAFDVLGPAAPLTSDQLQMLVEGSATPENAIQSVFGIRPLSFEDGLRKFLLPAPSPKNQTRG